MHFFLNDSDEVGDCLEPGMWKIASHGPHTEIKVKNKHNNCITVYGKQEYFIVYGAQAGCVAFFSSKDFQNPHNYRIDNYWIDPERINETGFGMGAESAYKLAAICSPTKIAVLVINSGIIGCETTKVVVFSIIPIWSHHGENEGNMVTILI